MRVTKLAPAPAVAGVPPAAYGLPQDAGGPERESALRLLHEEVASGRAPAIQYRHFTADSVLLAVGEGWADVERRSPVSERTSFHGFSVTKTLTALAILQLAEQGRIELDAPASDHLPEFPYGTSITVRHLLAHSAGIPNPMPLTWIHLAEENAGFDRDAFFDRLFARHGKVSTAPNERMRYSNLGYVLLGRILERASGQRYERYVSDHILSPLGLGPEELGFEIDPSTHAIGHQKRRSFGRLLLHFLIDDRRFLEPGRERWQAFRPYHVNGAPYGGLIGTAGGFTRYVQGLLDPGSGLLGDASRRMLFAENILEDGTPSGMALSWFAGGLNGHGYHAHAGGGGGYYAEIRIYPRLGRGSVVLVNRTGFSDKRFLDRVDRHLLPPAS